MTTSSSGLASDPESTGVGVKSTGRRASSSLALSLASSPAATFLRNVSTAEFSELAELLMASSAPSCPTRESYGSRHVPKPCSRTSGSVCALVSCCEAILFLLLDLACSSTCSFKLILALSTVHLSTGRRGPGGPVGPSRLSSVGISAEAGGVPSAGGSFPSSIASFRFSIIGSV